MVTSGPSTPQGASRLPPELWTHILSFLRRPLTPCEGEGILDLSQRDLVTCMRVNETFNKAAAIVLYSELVVDRLDLLAVGVKADSHSSTRADIPAGGPCKRPLTKAECLKLVKCVHIERHPDLTQLADENRSYLAPAGLDALIRRMHAGIGALISTNAFQQGHHRLRHVHINHFRPLAEPIEHDEPNCDIDLDADLIELVFAVAPHIACVFGGGIGTRIPWSTPHDVTTDSSRSESVRWVACYGPDPEADFLRFLLRLAKVDIVPTVPKFIAKTKTAMEGPPYCAYEPAEHDILECQFPGLVIQYTHQSLVKLCSPYIRFVRIYLDAMAQAGTLKHHRASRSSSRTWNVWPPFDRSDRISARDSSLGITEVPTLDSTSRRAQLVLQSDEAFEASKNALLQGQCATAILRRQAILDVEASKAQWDLPLPVPPGEVAVLIAPYIPQLVVKKHAKPFLAKLSPHYDKDDHRVCALVGNIFDVPDAITLHFGADQCHISLAALGYDH